MKINQLLPAMGKKKQHLPELGTSLPMKSENQVLICFHRLHCLAYAKNATLKGHFFEPQEKIKPGRLKNLATFQLGCFDYFFTIQNTLRISKNNMNFFRAPLISALGTSFAFGASASLGASAFTQRWGSHQSRGEVESSGK